MVWHRPIGEPGEPGGHKINVGNKFKHIKLNSNVICVHEQGSWCEAPRYTRCRYRQRLRDGKSYICEVTAL